MWKHVCSPTVHTAFWRWIKWPVFTDTCSVPGIWQMQEKISLPSRSPVLWQQWGKQRNRVCPTCWYFCLQERAYEEECQVAVSTTLCDWWRLTWWAPLEGILGTYSPGGKGLVAPGDRQAHSNLGTNSNLLCTHKKVTSYIYPWLPAGLFSENGAVSNSQEHI